MVGKLPLLTILLAACLAAMPWSERITSILIVAVAVASLVGAIIHKPTGKVPWMRLLLATMLFLIALVWVLFSAEMGVGLKYTERLLSALLFPLIFWLEYRKNHVLPSFIFRVFIASCVLRFVFFMMGFLDIELLFILDYWKELAIQFNQFFKEGALHPTYFGIYMGFSAIASFHYALSSATKRKAFLWLTMVFAIVLVLLGVGSKMPLLATLLALSYMAWRYWRRLSGNVVKWRYALVYVLLLALVSLYFVRTPNAIVQDLKNYQAYFSDSELDTSYDYGQLGTNYDADTWKKTNRVYIWASALKLVRQHGFFGVGTGDIQGKLNAQYRTDGQAYLAGKSANTHNQYLDYLIKYGVIGFGCILWAFVAYFKKATRANDGRYMAFLILVFCCLLTENILNRQMGITFFFLVNSLFFFKPGHGDG